VTSAPSTVPAYLLARAAQTPAAVAYLRRTEAGWRGETWQSVLSRVRNLSAQLTRLGLRPGDRVAIVMPTCIEWELCHLAALASGCAVVGVDAHDAPENIGHILRTVAPSALFVADAGQRAALVAEFATPDLLVIAMGSDPGVGGHVLADLLEQPAALPEGWPLATPDGLATVIFTSGSTGRPKGVAYTHAQLCLACEAILRRFAGVGEGARFACWLPLSNLFQRIINLCGMVRGGESYFVSVPTEIIGRLPEIQPTLFIGVPRFFEKLHAGIEARLAGRPAWVRRGVQWARAVGARYRALERQGRRATPWLSLEHWFANVLFLARIRAFMGARLQFMVSGSAPLPVWVMESFHALGWLVLEAYGTSENVIPIAINAPEAYRFGSVGRPLPENEVRIADDGELLVRGPGVFSGYYGESGQASPLDAGGFLRTGDYARLDEDSFLWLTGRKSDVFKTSTGRRVAPVPIEAHLKKLPYVEHAMVVGQQRPVPVALLCVDPRLLAGAAGPLAAGTLSQIAQDLTSICAALPAHDRPAGVVVIREGFSIGGGELTSNLKLKRAAIESKYRSALDALYEALAARPGHGPPLVQEAS
jgi:long-chain acyl-CoA synthetase